MWSNPSTKWLSCGHQFRGGRCARNSFRRQRRNTCRSERKHTNHHMWSALQEEMITMWSGRAENCFIRPLQLWYFNSYSSGCQVPSAIKSALKIWYAVSKEKTRRDHLHHQGANPLAHTWWRWSHFAFRIGNNFVRTQKFICSKQRKGARSNAHLSVSGYIGANIGNLKFGFATIQKIQRSCNLFWENSWFLQLGVVE